MHVIVNVHGGVIQAAFALHPETQIVVVDWNDDASSGAAASVAVLHPFPLSDLAGTDVLKAVAAAGIQVGTRVSEQRPGPTSPDRLSADALLAIVSKLQRELFGDTDDSGEPCWNIDKEWAPTDICMELASLLERHGLTP